MDETGVLEEQAHMMNSAIKQMDAEGLVINQGLTMMPLLLSIAISLKRLADTHAPAASADEGARHG